MTFQRSKNYFRTELKGFQDDVSLSVDLSDSHLTSQCNAQHSVLWEGHLEFIFKSAVILDSDIYTVCHFIFQKGPSESPCVSHMPWSHMHIRVHMCLGVPQDPQNQ